MITRKTRKATLLLLFVSLGLVRAGCADSIYDQPYLGVWPRMYGDRFSAEVWRQQATTNLAAVVQQSDLIILASATQLQEIKAPFNRDHIALYEADVQLLETLKGKTAVLTFHLRFEPSATGIGRGARHIFFLKQAGAGFKVLKACYVFPQGQGYDNHMRIVGAYDCAADVGTDIIKYLIDGQVPAHLEARLLAEYRSKGWMPMYSAVVMAAAAAPDVGMPVLKAAVSPTNPKRFDLQLYGTAAYALARQQNPEAWSLLLQSVPAVEDYGRVPESIAFDLAATLGNEKLVAVLQDVVAKRPELAVSAAFALSHIGGQAARDLITSWLSDERLSRRETSISNGWMRQKRSFADLFQQALAQMS